MGDPSVITIVQFLSVGGAAAALAWIVWLVVHGGLHTSSEVDGLREDKEQLILINKAQADAIRQSNETLRVVIDRIGK